MQFAHSADPREKDKALAIEWLKKQGAIDVKN
jgi:hypothetical protein